MSRVAAHDSSYRVWLTRLEGAIPSTWDATPEVVVAVEPLDDACYTRDKAAALAEGFNAAMLACRATCEDARAWRWAVVVPVQVVFEGDLVVGNRYRSESLVQLRRMHRTHAWPTGLNARERGFRR